MKCNSSAAAKLAKASLRSRVARIESLEDRQLLSATPFETAASAMGPFPADAVIAGSPGEGAIDITAAVLESGQDARLNSFGVVAGGNEDISLSVRTKMPADCLAATLRRRIQRLQQVRRRT